MAPAQGMSHATWEECADAAIAALDAARSTQPEEEVRELSLRLAQVHEFLARATVDEDTGELQEDAGGLLSALDYAVRGDPGCVDPGENESERCAALARHREYLGLAERLEAARATQPEGSDLYITVDGKRFCNACNVRPEFVGEHRCFGSDGGETCECPDPLCRMHRGEVTLAELEAEDAAAHVPEEPREKCARDSDWCDGRMCRERGIDCPYADPVPVEDEQDRVRTKPIDRYEQVVQLKAAITAQRHRVEVAEAALAQERETNAALRDDLARIASLGGNDGWRAQFSKLIALDALNSSGSRCPLCDDAGTVEQSGIRFDGDGELVGSEVVQVGCPYLNEPGHALAPSSGDGD